MSSFLRTNHQLYGTVWTRAVISDSLKILTVTWRLDSLERLRQAP